MNERPNPYQPPKSEIDIKQAPRELPLEPAHRGRRFFNYLIDLMGIYVLAIVFGILLFALFGEEVLLTSGPGVDYLFGASVMLTYYLVMEGLFGVTIGKLVTGTRIVSTSGGDPSLKQVLGRSLSRLVPFEPLSIFSETRRAWHDRWAGTTVVCVR